MNNGEIKIEKGIPMPQRFQRGSWLVIKDMAIGDSFVVDAGKRASICGYGKRYNMKLSTRKIDDTKIRVWRLA